MPKAQTPTERREADPPQVADTEPEEGHGPETPEPEETPEIPAEEESTGEENQAQSEFVAASDRLLADVATWETEDQTGDLDQVAEAVRRLDERLTETGREDTPSIGTARQYETRERAIEEALGEKLTVESVRSLKALASMGSELYSGRVKAAVKERVRALGERANAEAYEASLMAMRDVAYVESEIEAYGSLKQETFKPPSRHTVPPGLDETKRTRRVRDRTGESGEQPNVFKRDRQKE